MTRHSENRWIIIAFFLGMATFAAMLVMTGQWRFPAVLGETQDPPSAKEFFVFNGVLDRIRIRIYSGTGIIERDVRQSPYSAGLTLYGRIGSPWYSAKVECSDSDTPSYTGAYSEIILPMFYSPVNQDNGANNWGPVPVVVIDSCFAGAFKKEFLVDGRVIFTYTASAPHGPWVHFNLVTGEVLSFWP